MSPFIVSGFVPGRGVGSTVFSSARAAAAARTRRVIDTNTIRIMVLPRAGVVPAGRTAGTSRNSQTTGHTSTKIVPRSALVPKLCLGTRGAEALRGETVTSDQPEVGRRIGATKQSFAPVRSQ